MTTPSAPGSTVPLAGYRIGAAGLYRQIVEQTHEGVWACDPAGRTLFANRRMAEMLGCTPARLDSATIWEFLEPEHRDSVRDNFARRRAGQTDQHERRFRRLDGGLLLTLVSAAALTDADGHHIGSFALVCDITARTEAEAALAEREARLRALFDHAKVGQMLISPDGVVLQANAAVECMTGHGAGTMEGRHLLDMAHAAGGRHQIVGLARSLLAGKSDSGDIEVPYRRPDGTVVVLVISVGVVRDGDGATAYLTAVVQDITATRDAEARLVTLAHYDPVTGLANRTLLVEDLDRALGRSRPVAILFGDLDGFKAVNDNFGHAVGDHLLAAIGDRIRRIVRPGDTAARFGGDEFVVIAPLSDVADATSLAERLLVSVRQPYQVDGLLLAVEMSLGVAVDELGDGQGSTLLEHADRALYRAKAQGRGGCVVFTTDLGWTAPPT